MTKRAPRDRKNTEGIDLWNARTSQASTPIAARSAIASGVGGAGEHPDGLVEVNLERLLLELLVHVGGPHVLRGGVPLLHREQALHATDVHQELVARDDAAPRVPVHLVELDPPVHLVGLVLPVPMEGLATQGALLREPLLRAPALQHAFHAIHWGAAV